MRASRLLSLSRTTLAVSLKSFTEVLLTDGDLDVTEIIGSEKVDMGFKAMIHTLAVKVYLKSRVN